MQPNDQAQVQTLAAQAAAARKEDRLEDAQRDLTRVVEICRREGDEALLARALPALGQIERDLEHTEQALALYTEAAGLHRSLGNVQRLAHTIRHVADIHLDRGEIEQAEPHYKEALDLYGEDERTQPLDFANAIRGMALLREKTGEKQQAKALWENARDLYSAVNVEAGVEESSRRIEALG